jgi:Family of unknown function (DUF5631)/Family of unknown function (DUF5632)
VAIFGRITARKRLRRATRESLTIPAFSSPIDCTPWVIGGLWPDELSTISAENATLAQYLKIDLQRIASTANDELKIIRRWGMADSARQAEEARVIDDARARATRRVESAIRHLRTVTAEMPRTQIVPAIKTVKPAVDAPLVTAPPPHWETTGPAADEDDESAAQGRHRAPAGDTAAQAPEPEVADVPEASGAPVPAVESESDSERLQRLLAYVVRQEPGLSWAVGDKATGTTVLVTDLAHGWIPPGITLPEGVRLLEPERRSGNAPALVGDTTSAASYAPGDSLGRSVDFAATHSSVRPRDLPAIEDLGWVLGQATHWRDGLPRMVHTLARAAAAGTGVVHQEVDVLRVHLDTARYRLLGQYPDVDPALLLNCLLLAATEAMVIGDYIAANYHFAWFQKLSAPPASRWAAKQPF